MIIMNKCEYSNAEDVIPIQRHSQPNPLKNRLIFVCGPCIQILFSDGDLVESESNKFEFKEDALSQYKF
jgi:hypothetical protein